MTAIAARCARTAGGVAGQRIALAVLLVTTICVFVPLEPMMPRPALDESWALGLDQAVAQHLQFGRDLIFQQGPYSAVFSRMYHPATDTLSLVASGLLAVAYWVALTRVLDDAKRWLPWAHALVLVLVLAQARDALLLSYPLLVGVACQREQRRITLALLLAPFGLLPLVKTSLLPACALVALVVVGRALGARRWRDTAVAITAPLVTLIGFWLLAGQDLTGLPRFFIATIPVVSGYAAAMAWTGPTLEVVLFVVGALALLGILVYQNRYALAAVVAASLFIAFKASYVRHDSHALIGPSVLLFAALLVELKHRPALLLASGAIWLHTSAHYIAMSPGAVAARGRQPFVSAWRGTAKRLGRGTSLAEDYDVNMRFIAYAHPLPVLAGTTDVYSFGQTALIASGNRWNPRPVLQSYSVYTDDLDAANRSHLTGPHAPDNIILRVEPIDFRFPSLEDGSSWPTLLARYTPLDIVRDAIILRQRAQPLATDLPLLSRVEARLGHWIDVPASDDPVFVQIDLEPSPVGIFASILYKPATLSIEVKLTDGGRRGYRYIAAMGRAGFVISPLVEDAHDFATLYRQFGTASDKRVISFRVKTDGSKRSWRKVYPVTFSAIASR